jgi:hypothetical protein
LNFEDHNGENKEIRFLTSSIATQPRRQETEEPPLDPLRSSSSCVLPPGTPSLAPLPLRAFLLPALPLLERELRLWLQPVELCPIRLPNGQPPRRTPPRLMSPLVLSRRPASPNRAPVVTYAAPRHVLLRPPSAGAASLPTPASRRLTDAGFPTLPARVTPWPGEYGISVGRWHRFAGIHSGEHRDASGGRPWAEGAQVAVAGKRGGKERDTGTCRDDTRTCRGTRP